MEREKVIINADGIEFEFNQDYAHVISKHEVIDKDTICFYHYVPQFERGGDGVLKFIGKKEVEWFKFQKRDNELRLRSDCKMYFDREYSCSDSTIMIYLRKCSGAELKSSRALPKMDEDNYGRMVERGKFLYEVWDVGGMFNLNR